jgi:hypothetical protein
LIGLEPINDSSADHPGHQFPPGALQVALFPLLGIGYQVVVSASLGDYEVEGPTDLSAFKVLGGAGADFALGERLYLRTTLLGGYRFKSKFESDLADLMDSGGSTRGAGCLLPRT